MHINLCEDPVLLPQRVLPSTTLFKVQENLEGLKQEEEEQRAESGLMDYRSGTVSSRLAAQGPLRASYSLCFSWLVRIEVFQKMPH